MNRTICGILLASVLSCVALAADISGAWQFKLESANSKGTPSFEFQQTGEALTGTYMGKFGKAPVSGTVKGTEVEFSFQAPNASGKFHYKGTVDESGALKGEYELEGTEKGTFTATKK